MRGHWRGRGKRFLRAGRHPNRCAIASDGIAPTVKAHPMKPALLFSRLLLWLPVLATAANDPKTSYVEWQTYNGDYGGAHYSALDQINRTA